MKAFWRRIARELSPYVPGEQPRIANLVKLNTNENPTHDRGAAGFGASLPSAHVAAIDRICPRRGERQQLARIITWRIGPLYSASLMRRRKRSLIRQIIPTAQT